MASEIQELILIAMAIAVIIAVAYWQYAQTWRYSDDRIGMKAQAAYAIETGQKVSSQSVYHQSDGSVTVLFADGKTRTYAVVESTDPLQTCTSACLIL